MWHQLPWKSHSTPERKQISLPLLPQARVEVNFQYLVMLIFGGSIILAGMQIELKRIDFAAGCRMRVVTRGTATTVHRLYAHRNNSGRRRK